MFQMLARESSANDWNRDAFENAIPRDRRSREIDEAVTQQRNVTKQARCPRKRAPRDFI